MFGKTTFPARSDDLCFDFYKWVLKNMRIIYIVTTQSPISFFREWRGCLFFTNHCIFPTTSRHFKPPVNKQITVTLLFQLQFLSVSVLSPQMHIEDCKWPWSLSAKPHGAYLSRGCLVVLPQCNIRSFEKYLESFCSKWVIVWLWLSSWAVYILFVISSPLPLLNFFSLRSYGPLLHSLSTSLFLYFPPLLFLFSFGIVLKRWRTFLLLSIKCRTTSTLCRQKRQKTALERFTFATEFSIINEWEWIMLCVYAAFRQKPVEALESNLTVKWNFLT